MADQSGWAMLGDALGGTSEESYQKGLAMGANTQNALAQARARVDENKAKIELVDVLTNIPGVTPKMAAVAGTVVRAGGNVGDGFAAALKQQEFDNRAAASDPNVPLDVGQRRMLGVGSGPAPNPLQKIGGGYYNIFDTKAGITPLGDSLGGEGGGSAAGMQYARALGLIDAEGNVVPGMEATFYDVVHPTGRVTDEAGVPGKLDFNPYRGGGGGVPPVRGPAPAAPAPAAPAAPAAAAGAGITPVSTAERVGANAAEIERAKVVGKGVGEAQLSLPQAQARFNNQTAQMDLVMSDIDELLPEVSGWTAGPGGKFLANIWGTPAYDLASAVDVIKANIGFQQLQQMRYESPTGGALGQVAVQELQFLQAALGNLQQAQSPAQLRRMLGQVRGRYENFKKAAAADYAAAQQMARGNVAGATGAATAPSGDGWQTINGVRIRVKPQ